MQEATVQSDWNGIASKPGKPSHIASSYRAVNL